MPLTAALKKEIDTVLETVLLMAPTGATLKQLSRSAYDSERKLFDQVQETWMLDRIEWLLARKRQTIRSVDESVAVDRQFMLPGFERIPTRLTMRNGRRVATRRAILSEVREYRAALLLMLTNQRNTIAAKDPTQDPRIIALDRLIELMEKYAVQGKTVTVGDVMLTEKVRQENHAT